VGYRRHAPGGASRDLNRDVRNACSLWSLAHIRNLGDRSVRPFRVEVLRGLIHSFTTAVFGRCRVSKSKVDCLGRSPPCGARATLCHCKVILLPVSLHALNELACLRIDFSERVYHTVLWVPRDRTLPDQALPLGMWALRLVGAHPVGPHLHLVGFYYERVPTVYTVPFSGSWWRGQIDFVLPPSGTVPSVDLVRRVLDRGHLVSIRPHHNSLLSVGLTVIVRMVDSAWLRWRSLL
jgi:hypothetical protein